MADLFDPLRRSATMGLLLALAASCKTSDTRPAAPSPAAFDAAPVAIDAAPAASPTASKNRAIDISAVFLDPKRFGGKKVRVVGDVREGNYQVDLSGAQPRGVIGSIPCTELHCAPATCCNSCHGDAAVVSGMFGLRLVRKDGKPYRCEGNECSIQCKPPKGRYAIVGTVRLPVGLGTIDLIVEKLERLP